MCQEVMKRTQKETRQQYVLQNEIASIHYKNCLSIECKYQNKILSVYLQKKIQKIRAKAHGTTWLSIVSNSKNGLN